MKNNIHHVSSHGITASNNVDFEFSRCAFWAEGMIGHFVFENEEGATIPFKGDQ